MKDRQKTMISENLDKDTYSSSTKEVRLSCTTSITQVTITACTQGTYSFPVSAIISKQAVDLILHEKGKTNIQ